MGWIVLLAVIVGLVFWAWRSTRTTSETDVNTEGQQYLALPVKDPVDPMERNPALALPQEHVPVGEADYNALRIPKPGTVRKREGNTIVAVVGQSNYRHYVEEVLGEENVGPPASGPTPTRTAYLLRESNNPHDPKRAVVVAMEAQDGNLVRVGYIAANRVSPWHSILDEASQVGEITTCDATFYAKPNDTIHIQLRTKRP